MIAIRSAYHHQFLLPDRLQLRNQPCHCRAIGTYLLLGEKQMQVLNDQDRRLLLFHLAEGVPDVLLRTPNYFTEQIDGTDSFREYYLILQQILPLYLHQ